MDKVLLGEIFILISFDGKAFTQVNLQEMWMNSNMFPSSTRLNCVILINLNLGAVYKG